VASLPSRLLAALAGAGVSLVLAGPAWGQSDVVVDPGSIGGPCSDDRPAGQVSRARPLCSIAAAVRRVGADSGTISLRRAAYGPTTVTRAAAAGWIGIRPAAGEAAAVRVRGLTLQNASRVRVEGLRLDGIGVWDSADVDLSANTVTGHGIYLRRTTRTRVRCNTVASLIREARGLLAQGYGSAAGTTALEVSWNDFHGLTHDAIAVYNGARGVTVTGNDIYGLAKAPGSVLHVDAMQFTGGTGYQVRGNYVHDVLHGLLFKDGRSTGVTVRDNVVTRIGSSPLEMFDTPGALIERNILWGTPHAVRLDDGGTGPSGAGFRVIGNAIQRLIAPAGFIAHQSGNLIGFGPLGPTDRTGSSPPITPPPAGPGGSPVCDQLRAAIG
jgi:Right handed beta helix region